MTQLNDAHMIPAIHASGARTGGYALVSFHTSLPRTHLRPRYWSLSSWAVCCMLQCTTLCCTVLHCVEYILRGHLYLKLFWVPACRHHDRNSVYMYCRRHSDFQLGYLMSWLHLELCRCFSKRLGERRKEAHCSPLQPTATHCSPLQPTATHCNPLQRSATHCDPLQRSATHCDTPLILSVCTHLTAQTTTHTHTHRWTKHTFAIDSLRGSDMSPEMSTASEQYVCTWFMVYV